VSHQGAECVLETLPVCFSARPTGRSTEQTPTTVAFVGRFHPGSVARPATGRVIVGWSSRPRYRFPTVCR